MDEENNNGTEQEELKRILYVDDVNYSLLTVRERLKNRYDVLLAQSVEKMFELLERKLPDLILLDVNMPEVNGYDAIKKLKADGRYSGIPVVFFSAKNNISDIKKGMKAGAADFITKPVSNEKLIEYIEFNIDDKMRKAIKPVILAIDDTPSILHAINEILGEKYIVYTLPEVKTTHVLSEFLKKVTPDLFMLDYEMPGLTGFDLVPIIRKMSGYEEIPIMFLTGKITIDHVTVATNLGACDYIVKPIDKKVLQDKVDLHIADYVMHRRIRSLTNDRLK